MKDLRIVVLHRGFVLVGFYRREGDYSFLEKANVIRRWGTSNGLGEIAMSGPNEQTILDPEPEGEFHYCQIIRTIKCDQSKWNGYCDEGL